MSSFEPLPFWRNKALNELSEQEWESLCDGCGKCCLIKLEYEEDGSIEFTDICCALLDPESGRCRSYADRQNRVLDCVQITADTLAEMSFLPESCAYRRLAEGRDLAIWHPLVSGNRQSVHLAGMSVRNRVISEEEIAQEAIVDRIVQWPKRPG